jgi:hypothetical protein
MRAVIKMIFFSALTFSQAVQCEDTAKAVTFFGDLFPGPN